MLWERRIKYYAENMFDPDSAYLCMRCQKNRTFIDKTIAIRAGLVNNYVIPFWGHCRLSKLTIRDIDEKLMNAVSIRDKKPLSGCEKNVILNILSDIFRLAIADGYITYNPAAEVLKFSQAIKNHRNAIPKDEMKLLFPESHDGLIKVWKHQKFIVAYLILRDTGLRPGELRALKWQDWHSDLRFFPVTKAIESGKKNKIKGTKTGSVKPAIVTEMTATEIEMLRESTGNCDTERFIIADKNNIPYTVDRLVYNFKQGVIRASLNRPEYTPYWLRHTFNTRILDILPDETVRLLMGHSTEAMTRHYRHPDIDSLRAEAKKILEKLALVT